MDTCELVIYEGWAVAAPAIPPRSRLFHLVPVGIGTSEAESLTSYVTRLAEAHSVPVRELVMHEILPFLGRPHLADAKNASLLSAFWRNETRALNGTRTLARNLVRTLETLTGRHDLRFLTLLTWADILPVMHLQRRSRAWCPSCYEEWRQTGQVIYEPLIWSLLPVTICHRHRWRLRLVCPYPDCQRPSPWLSSWSRSGRCARCGRWLGVMRDLEPAEGERLLEQEVQAQVWIARAVGELIAAAPNLTMPPQQGRIAQVLSDAVERLAGGSRNAFSRKLGLGRVEEWCHGAARPSLWLLLDLCSRLGTTPLQFLCGEAGDASRAPDEEFLLQGLPHRPQWRHTIIDRDAARRDLEAMLAGDEQPPPSLREVAQRLGYTYSSLRHHLPELCRTISERFLSYQLAQGVQTRLQVRDEVRKVALRVHSEGLYPSASRIAALLSDPGAIRSRPAREAWHEVLRELDWQT